MLKMQFKVLFTLFFVVRYFVNGVPLEAAPTNMARYFDPRIIGGAEASQGQFPYVAAILIGDDFIMVACGGSILLPNLILTAAHCIDEYQVAGGLMRTFHAVVGSNNFRSGGITVQFKGYHIHPDWNRDTMKNDLGMLPLEETLELSEAIQLIALGFDHVDRQPSVVVGWGLIATRPAITPFNLQILEVDTLDPQVCVDVVSEASAAMWPEAPIVDPDLEICSLYSGGRRGMQQFTPGLCFGDSGSPLMSKLTGLQIGVVSWAFPCATGVPDVHTRISPYKGWFKDTMGLYPSNSSEKDPRLFKR